MRPIRWVLCIPALLLLIPPASAQQMESARPVVNWPAPLLWSGSEPGGGPAGGAARPESAAALPTSPLALVGLTPCRIVDTRGNGFAGLYGPPSLIQGVPRSFPLAGQCGIAPSAQAVSVNVTVTNTAGPGFILIYAQGGALPLVSTLNYVAGQTVANAAVVPLGTAGGITVIAGVSGTDLILDTNGYYDDSGLITSVVPGTGLTGGGSSGTVTLSIAAGGVTSTELASSSVTSSKIAAGAVTAGAIGAGQVGSTQLADGAVVKNKLAATGGANGQVLATDGTSLLWQPQGPTLPYSGTTSSNTAGFSITNTTTQPGAVGIYGESAGFSGIYGAGPVGVVGSSPGGSGVFGTSNLGWGVEGSGKATGGVHGVSSTAGYGVFGESTDGSGVGGRSQNSYGVRGISINGYGVYGLHSTYTGYLAYSDGGVLGEETVSGNYGYLGMSNYAGLFSGPVQINGTLTATGVKSFRIDHPLDPENRELWHAAIESSEVLNVYSGNAVTDEDARAVVELPAWFEAINTDFRYQLTVIGQFARAIVEKEIEQNRFTIATSPPKVKVSWQVTARRNDPWMRAHPFAVEREKPSNERGTYRAPLEHGQPLERGVEWARHPEVVKGPKEDGEQSPAAKAGPLGDGPSPVH